MRTAAIITIGSELVEGLRTDTNGPKLARELSKLGYVVVQTVSVVDGYEELKTVYESLCSRFDLVVSTGGLGPTHDDVTRESAAAALGLQLHEDQEIKESLHHYAQRYTSYEIKLEIYSQAQVLEGAVVLKPIAGTAPGQVVPTSAGKLVLLPGPPKECMPLFAEYAKEIKSTAARHIDFSIFGLMETEVQHIVQPLLEDYTAIGFTVLASPKEVHAILTDLGAGEMHLEEAAGKVRKALGTCVFSEEGESLAETVFKLARKRHLTIASAESCTGGLVAGELTDTPGSSEVFVGGIVSYANSVKEVQLGVSRGDLATYGAVSPQVAAAMALGARERLNADLAISITGIAGPDGGTAEKPVGTVWFGIADKDGVETVLRHKGGTRDAIRLNSTSAACDFLRRRILGLSLEHELESILQ